MLNSGSLWTSQQHNERFYQKKTPYQTIIRGGSGCGSTWNWQPKDKVLIVISHCISSGALIKYWLCDHQITSPLQEAKLVCHKLERRAQEIQIIWWFLHISPALKDNLQGCHFQSYQVEVGALKTIMPAHFTLHIFQTRDLSNLTSPQMWGSSFTDSLLPTIAFLNQHSGLTLELVTFPDSHDLGLSSISLDGILPRSCHCEQHGWLI